MLIRDVLILAAESLGRTDLSASIRSAYSAAVSSGTVPAGETAVLLRCYRLVENEVALDHLPLKAEERMMPSEGYLAFTDFSARGCDRSVRSFRPEYGVRSFSRKAAAQGADGERGR